jgi:predicted ArsR family transcriptional regulator
VQRLALLKTLGDNTRYAIYLELARAVVPLATGDIAESLGLHPNTVRPHLERMRDVGLLDVEVDARGSVGRPQHRYFLAPDAPSLGLEPPAFPMLAEMLVDVVAASRPDPADVAMVGRARGIAAAEAAWVEAPGADAKAPPQCAASLMAELASLGYDPVMDGDTIAFTRCPYRDMAEIAPEVICGLHRGVVEGFVRGFREIEAGGTESGGSESGGTESGGLPGRAHTSRESWTGVATFHTLVDRDPCQMTLA